MNMLDFQDGPFRDLLSAAEAAEIWDIDPSAIRKAISNGRMVEGQDCRKFGKQWVVTVDAMARVFNETALDKSYGPWNHYLANLRYKAKYGTTPEV